MKIKSLNCDYCGNPAELVGGLDVYPHRPDLADKKLWRCVPCSAYVGCHDGTTRPLGRLANARLRAAKKRAHAAFDPMWKNQGATRKNAYAWLAARLGIRRRDCHIGMMDEDMCARVIEVCEKVEG